MEFPLHATIGVRALKVPEIALWYLCRGLDPAGSGKAFVPQEEIAKFGKHRCTIWRWLTNIVLFRSYRKVEGGIVIYYRSLLRVCEDYEIKDLGGIALTDEVTDLPSQAALIQAQRTQDQSRWLAIHGRGGERSDDRLPKALDLFDNEGKRKSWHIRSRGNSSPIKGIEGHELVFAGRDLVKLQVTTFFGASQEGIAKRLDISRKTLAKLLEPFEKVQVAIKSSWWHLNRAKFEQSENLGQETESGFLWVSKDNEFWSPTKLNPYIYYPLFQLTSQRQLRSKLRKRLAAGTAAAAS
jgi:hypothetical protein